MLLFFIEKRPILSMIQLGELPNFHPQSTESTGDLADTASWSRNLPPPSPLYTSPASKLHSLQPTQHLPTSPSTSSPTHYLAWSGNLEAQPSMVASILAGRHSRAAHHHRPTSTIERLISNDCLCINSLSSISPLPLHCPASQVPLDLDRSGQEGKNNLLVGVH